TARSGRPHTKMFQAERERLTLVVADTSPALYFGTRVRFKSVQAARAAAIAAWVAVRDGDRVAALRGSSVEPPVTPAGGSRGALRVLDALARWYARPPEADEGLDVALEHAERVLRPGSRLLVLADPASLAGVPDRRWPALAMHSQVLVLLPVDPLESDPPGGALALGAGRAACLWRARAGVARRRWRRWGAAAVLGAAERARVSQGAPLPLRGIHLPVEPQWWPPAPGWWLLGGLVLAALVAAAVLIGR